MVKFYATWRDYPSDGLLRDPNFISFCNISPRGTFFWFQFTIRFSIFDPRISSSPVTGSSYDYPHGVPFLSLSVLYLPEEKVFWFQFTVDFFLTSEIFYFPWRNHFVIPYAISLELFFSLKFFFYFNFSRVIVLF